MKNSDETNFWFQNSNLTELKDTSYSVTLNSANWTGSAAPYSYKISNSAYTANNIYDVIINITTQELSDNVPSYKICGATKSAGNITLYAWGTKPSINIPVTIVKRGDY